MYEIIYIYLIIGVCNLNDFKIYTTIPSTFQIKFTVEINDDFIELDNNLLDVNITDCFESQIKIYEKDKFYYCENPKCNNDCPVSNKTAECIKGEENYYNKVSLNKCQCIPGWIDDKSICDSKKYTDFSFM